MNRRYLPVWWDKNSTIQSTTPRYMLSARQHAQNGRTNFNLFSEHKMNLDLERRQDEHDSRKSSDNANALRTWCHRYHSLWSLRAPALCMRDARANTKLHDNRLRQVTRPYCHQDHISRPFRCWNSQQLTLDIYHVTSLSMFLDLHISTHRKSNGRSESRRELVDFFNVWKEYEIFVELTSWWKTRQKCTNLDMISFPD